MFASYDPARRDHDPIPVTGNGLIASVHPPGVPDTHHAFLGNRKSNLPMKFLGHPFPINFLSLVFPLFIKADFNIRILSTAVFP